MIALGFLSVPAGMSTPDSQGKGTEACSHGAAACCCGVAGGCRMCATQNPSSASSTSAHQGLRLASCPGPGQVVTLPGQSPKAILPSVTSSQASALVVAWLKPFTAAVF